MASGETPTLTIGNGTHSVTLVDEHSAWPPPPVQQRREIEERITRVSGTGARVSFDQVHPWRDSLQSLRFEVPHLLEEQRAALQAMYQEDPPLVVVSYMSMTWLQALLIDYSPNPDPFRPTEYQASIEIKRVDAI